MNLVIRRLRALATGSFLRFFGASLAGLAIDIALAGALHHAAGLALVPAAAISLLATACLMYFVHEFWTFRGAGGQASAARLSGTVISALAALAVRSASLYASSTLLGLGDRFALVQLAAATGFSFVLNYVLVRRIIQGRRPVSPPA